MSTRMCNKHHFTESEAFLLVFWASDALSQSAKKEGTVLRYAIDPNYQGEIWLFSQNGDKEDYVQSVGDFLGSLLELPCHVINVSGNLQQPNPGRRIKDPDISDIKHASPLQVKHEDLLESLLRAEEIQKYRMGSEGWHIYKTKQTIKNHQVTSYRNEDCN